ncbi:MULTISPECIES: hypothetical protein [unclassified Providencia]|uniref:hypothetical protein n=1 Tax=unclassified Providencia TaxID=2633465 RepID=UPI00234B95DA|nr:MULTISPECIES: hypothetical protein [unclassified Providencia]
MSFSGIYYLHENGDLIYKPGLDSVADVRESSFAKCSWLIDPSNRKCAWEILIEAQALGANKERIDELADKWKCNDDDAGAFADVVGVVIKADGDMWCAHKQDFTNIQEHPVGFGITKLDAMSDLAKSLGLTGGHLWRKTFSEHIADY